MFQLTFLGFVVYIETHFFFGHEDRVIHDPWKDWLSFDEDNQLSVETDVILLLLRLFIQIWVQVECYSEVFVGFYKLKKLGAHLLLSIEDDTPHAHKRSKYSVI